MAYVKYSKTRKGYGKPRGGRGSGAKRPRSRKYSSRTAGGGAVAKRVAALQLKVENLEHGKAKKVILRGYPSGLPLYIGPRGEDAVERKYFAVPVTTAIMPPSGGGVLRAEQLREGRKVKVRGITIEFSAIHLCGFRYSAVCYEAKGPSLTQGVATVGGVPNSFPIGEQLGDDKYGFLNLGQTGFVDTRDGPFEVIAERDPSGAEDSKISYSLASSDGTMYQCPLQKGAGAPIGTVEWRAGDRTAEKQRGMTANGSVAAPSSQLSDTIGKLDSVKMYFDISRSIEFTLEESNNLVCSQHIQVMVCLLPSVEVLAGNEMQAWGCLRDVKATIHYRG